MSMLRTPHFRRPENLHEIARLRFFEIVEVAPEPEFMEKPGRSRAVGIPAAPDPGTIALPADEQLVERRLIQTEGAAVAQRYDGFQEDEIGGPGAIARRRRDRLDEKFACLELHGGL